MTIIDDLKQKTEVGFKTLRDTAEDIAVNIEKQARVGRRKVDILRIQKRIQKVNTEIGEYVYGEWVMERSISFASPFLKDRMTIISEMKIDIRDLETEIEDIRNTQTQNNEQ
jgi:hypothetical protein